MGKSQKGQPIAKKLEAAQFELMQEMAEMESRKSVHRIMGWYKRQGIISKNAGKASTHTAVAKPSTPKNPAVEAFKKKMAKQQAKMHAQEKKVKAKAKKKERHAKENAVKAKKQAKKSEAMTTKYVKETMHKKSAAKYAKLNAAKAAAAAAAKDR